MRLHNIPSGKGMNRPRKRVGRGHGSGHGKTSGRGQKGQLARSGGSVRPMFESGHIPLYRRLPNRGFNRARFQQEIAVVNVGDLARIEGTDTVDVAALKAAGLVRRNAPRVKLLGDGEIDRALKLTVDHASAGAIKKIEAAGGSVTVLAKKEDAAPAEEEKPADTSE